MVQFTLRLPEDIHRRLVAAAKRARRSLNGQVVYILEQWLDEPGDEDLLPVNSVRRQGGES